MSYEVHAKIGAGGAATVHIAKLVSDASFHRVVVVKRLLPHISRDEDARAALMSEALLAARVSHPNVVSLLDVFAEDKELFLVMEYVHGEALNRLLGASKRAGGPPPIAISLAIVAAVLRGLHAAHEARGLNGEPLDLVHRDVSPQNIVVGADGVPRLLDFGIAKATGRAFRTRTGEVKGKLGYMPPEQLCGEPIDRRTDIFAIGVVLWELLVGSRLFRGTTDEEGVVLTLKADVMPPSQRVPSVPLAIDAIVLKALAAKPNDRFATALEMAIALEKHPPIAPASEIGVWVEQLASEALAERTRLIAAMETASPELVLSSKDSALASHQSPHANAPQPSIDIQTAALNKATKPAHLRIIGAVAFVAITIAVLIAARLWVHPDVVPPTVTFAESESASASENPSSSDEPPTTDPNSAPSSSTEHPKPIPRRRPKPPSTQACNPPFTVDLSGRKHFKPECF